MRIRGTYCLRGHCCRHLDFDSIAEKSYGLGLFWLRISMLHAAEIRLVPASSHIRVNARALGCGSIATAQSSGHHLLFHFNRGCIHAARDFVFQVRLATLL